MPNPPLLRLSWACCQATSVVSTAVHDEKHLRPSSSKSSREAITSEGGVARARCASRQNLPHIRKSVKATRGSTAPTSSSLSSRGLASNLFLETKAEQKSLSPIGIPKISMLGLRDCFMSDGKELRSLWLKSSHFDTFTKRPSDGPIPLIITHLPFWKRE